MTEVPGGLVGMEMPQPPAARAPKVSAGAEKPPAARASQPSPSSGTDQVPAARAPKPPVTAGPDQQPLEASAAPALQRPADPAELPVAQVLVDTGLPHLDRPFEYSVPEELRERAQPGARVKVRFAGQDLPGYVLDRRPSAEHAGRLAPLRTVVSDEAVLTPGIRALAGELAAAYAGTVGDVLRLAIPPRHARAEKALATEAPALAESPPAPEHSAWSEYPAGAALLRRLAGGESPAAAWCAAPTAGAAGRDWPSAFAEAVRATVASGRGAIVVVPDHRDVDRLDAALSEVIGSGRHVRLTADQGPQARYTAWLKVLRGHAPVAIGTRAASFAPVRDLGLIAVWDDGDDLHVEPRAPYVHAAEVARRRSRIEGAALLVAGYGRSLRTQAWVQAGMPSLTASREVVRDRAPAVAIAGESERDQERDPAAASARLPTQAWRTAKAALTSGPVLIQVPRRGYLPAVACTTCRARARCPHCQGPLQIPAEGAAPVCRWCARRISGWTCPACEGHGLRSLVVGARRTAEEIGRAFPGVPVLTSGAGSVLASVPGRPALVIATPGAEPVAEGGYAAALLLDAWALTDRPALDAGPEALRRWLAAAALVRGRADDGRVVVVGLPQGPPVPAAEALVRWDPVWLATQELAEREVLHLPPAATFAEVTGPRPVLEEIAARPGIPAGVERFGPVPGAGDAAAYRLLLRAEPGELGQLASELRAVRGERSARKEADAVRVRVGVDDLD